MGRVSNKGSELATSQYSDVDVTVIKAEAVRNPQFVKGDGTPGKTGDGTFIHLVMETGGGKKIDNHYSCGKYVVPAKTLEDAEAGIASDTGDFLTGAEGKEEARIPATFDWGHFVAHLEKAGYDMESLDTEGYSSLEGKKFHIVNFMPPGKPARKDGKKDYGITVVSSILGGTSDTTTSTSKGNGIEHDLEPVVIETLKKAGPLGTAALNQQVSRALKAAGWDDTRILQAASKIVTGKWVASLPGVKFDSRHYSLSA